MHNNSPNKRGFGQDRSFKVSFVTPSGENDKIMNSFLHRLAHYSSFIGGSVLLGLVGLTCLSVAGRCMNSVLHTDFLQQIFPDITHTLIRWGIGPVNGDFELIEAGMAFVIFAFLPLCQLHAAHARVDLFSERMPVFMKRFFMWGAEVIFAAVLILITWQLANGLYDKFRSHETTLLLEMPVWWAYGLCMIMSIISAFTALILAWYKTAELFLTKLEIPSGKEDDYG